MLNVLLESRASKERRRGGTIASVVVHTAVIAAVVVVTAQKSVGATEPTKPRAVRVDYIHLKSRPPASEPAVAAAATASSAIAAPHIVAPSVPRFDFRRIPVGIPDGPLGDVSVAAPTGSSSGLVVDPYGSGVVIEPGSVIDERHVDRAARLTAAPAPRYPDRMRALGIEGRVLVQFVVDTTGHVELEGVKVLASAHEDLTLAVRQVLPRLRFVPAEVRGGKVRMLAQMPFEFALDRK